jgi:D-3-phosphoglycerate dehydrogenase
VDVKTGLSAEEIIQIIPEYDALMLRSSTGVTKEIVEAGQQTANYRRSGGQESIISMFRGHSSGYYCR